MTSVLVTVDEKWYPESPKDFMGGLFGKLPGLVADVLNDVDPTADIKPVSVMTNMVEFNPVWSENTPNAWIVVTIAESELNRQAKQRIRNELARLIREFVGQADVDGVPILSIDVDFANGSGIMIGADGETISSW